MNNLILRGGLLFVNRQTKKYEALNISLAPSSVWKSGVLYINHTHRPVYNFLPKEHHFIEIITDKNKHTLFINDAIVYESEQRYNYFINMKLNELRTNIPYRDFFNYY